MFPLSIFLPDGIAVGAAHIDPIGDVDLRDGAVLTFEVPEEDAGELKNLIGSIEQFGFEQRVFCGELVTLEHSETTDLGFALLDKPVLRGVLNIHKMLTPDSQN